MSACQQCGLDLNRHLAAICIQRPNPGAFDFYPDRSFEEGHGNNDALLLANFNQKSFESCQRPFFDLNALPDFQKGIRFRQKSRPYRSLNGANFRVVNRSWNPSNTNEMEDAWNGQ